MTRREHNHEPFNLPLESGLRSLILLVEAHPRQFDLQRLLILDYLLVHSGDAGGPPSLHPATPLRSGALLVRRDLIERGLRLMCGRGLVNQGFSSEGILYQAGDLACSYLDCLTARYTRSLRQRAGWVVTSFADKPEDELRQFVKSNVDRWGGEFQLESLFLGDDL